MRGVSVLIGFWTFLALFAAWCFVLCLVWLLDDLADRSADNDELIDKLDLALSRWEFHDVRLRVGPETAFLQMQRRDFLRAMLAAQDGEQ